MFLEKRVLSSEYINFPFTKSVPKGFEYVYNIVKEKPPPHQRIKVFISIH